jgi:hypothetical protein
MQPFERDEYVARFHRSRIAGDARDEHGRRSRAHLQAVGDEAAFAQDGV